MAPDVTHLIRLTRNALCDPKVLPSKMLNDVWFAVLQASLQVTRERNPDDYPIRINV